MKSKSQIDILIVDDTPENIKLLIAMLTKEGYNVRPALNGKQALLAIKKKLPDLILLDILMPEMDGFEVCRSLKSEPLYIDIPVIFLSAISETSNKIKGLKSGGVDYITKPFQIDEVLARVERQLSLKTEYLKRKRTGEYNHSELLDSQLKEICKQVENLISNQMFYRDPECSLDEISESIDIPKHNISEAINKIHNKNFNLLINEYRVKHFKKLLQTPDNRKLSLLRLAIESGFNSKSAFNSSFKKIMKQTPSEYLNSLTT